MGNKFVDVGTVIFYITKSEKNLLNVDGFEALFVFLFCMLLVGMQVTDNCNPK